MGYPGQNNAPSSIHLRQAPANVMLLTNRAFADAIQLKWRLYWITIGSQSNDWHPYKEMEIWGTETHRYTERRRSCGDSSRDWSYDATSQHLSHQKLEEARKDSSLG